MEKTIGIIANPASGKDIRRLVSYATIMDNQEKVNMLKRITLAAQSLGVERIYFMPDTNKMGGRVIRDLSTDKSLKAHCEILDFPWTDSAEDTIMAAQRMEALGAGCIVVLGGDGTCRAAAKGVKETQILPISTGTNNVYPVMAEGTVAGMAAAIAAGSSAAGALPREDTCIRDKRIELYLNGNLADIALIDTVITKDVFAGAKAIWETNRISDIMVTRCHPASIGFSAIAGCLAIVTAEDDFGYEVKADHSMKSSAVLAPVAAGMLQPFGVKGHGKLSMDKDYEYKIREDCMAALDGERELELREGDILTLRITRNGPWRVDIKKTIEAARLAGSFTLKK